jgi:hypothetical protein
MTSEHSLNNGRMKAWHLVDVHVQLGPDHVFVRACMHAHNY